jgi:uncharacterized membrane protein
MTGSERTMEESMESGQVPTGLKGVSLAGLVLGMGAFIAAVGLGVVPVDPKSVHAPGWVIVAAGIVFLAVGLFLLQQALRIEWLKPVPGFVMLVGLMAMGHWVAFGPGERKFRGIVSVVGIEAPLSSEVMGRATFGLGAILLDALVVAGLVRAIRTRLRRE